MESNSKNCNAAGSFAGRDLRLPDKATISAIFDCGLRASDARATLIGRKQSPELDRPRFAIAVGSRLGPAVKRNRIRRLYREACRLIRSELPTGIDFVVVPRSLGGLTLDAAKQTVQSLTQKLAAKLAKK